MAERTRGFGRARVLTLRFELPARTIFASAGDRMDGMMLGWRLERVTHRSGTIKSAVPFDETELRSYARPLTYYCSS
jgi:hypothetical protein